MKTLIHDFEEPNGHAENRSEPDVFLKGLFKDVKDVKEVFVKALACWNVNRLSPALDHALALSVSKTHHVVLDRVPDIPLKPFSISEGDILGSKRHL